ncbi:MAG: dihydroxy-acid dehydratase family protein [Fuerstiella sp.]|nr:dihydroxy-acid dehydratase family protein [Fuerstiella sp.]MCP4857914.1 dihydroxy-acid dehydratase family protein [Fuerstiella sp.]
MTDSSKRLRSEQWFNIPDDPGMTAIYVERYLNYGVTRDELQSGKPIIGIAQTGSDIAPCNRIHLQTVERAKDGIRAAGGVPFVFPVHPIQESCRRPTAALDRNLSYLGLVEIIHGYPFDAVILTAGCDKTTPAGLMAAATTNLPAIVLSGGPMLDGWYEGKLTGSGMATWEARRQLAAGQIDYQGFMDLVCSTTTSPGHCNTMGTALTMNCLAEVLGMSLPGSASIPAAYRERMQSAYETGQRAVEIVHENLTPDRILTRQAFENAIVLNTAIGGSTNAPPHLAAIARHVGVELNIKDWEDIGYDIPLLVNCQPAGDFLGEGFHRAGGVPAVVNELMTTGKIHTDALTISGKSLSENVADKTTLDTNVIRSYEAPLMQQAGFLVLSGNLFDSALMKTCVISEDFRERYLSRPGSENCFESRVVVFDGPEDYHARIEDPALKIDESCLLAIRGCGPIGYPGSGEVVNMQPPATLLQKGIKQLPTMGDGRQSGTSASPSLLNASPESAAGGNLALLQTDDTVRVDLNERTVTLMVSDNELTERRQNYEPPEITNETPWQEIYRGCVGQLATGGCFDFATNYQKVAERVPRHNH